MYPWDEEDRNPWARPGVFGQTSAARPPQQQDDGGFFGNITAPVKAVGGAVAAVGGFLGDMAKGIVEQVGEAAGSLKDLVVGISDLQTTDALMKKTDEIRSKVEAERAAGRISQKDAASILVELSKKEQEQSKKLSESGVMKRDPIKSGAAIAETALDVATLGGASAAKAATKEALRTAVKEGGKAAAKQAGKTIARNAGEGAAMGGTFGTLETLRQEGGDADLRDLWQGALIGGGAGGLLGGAASFLDPGVRAGVREIPGVARQGMADYRALPQAIREGGYVKIPGSPDNIPLPSANRPAGEIQLAIEKARNAGDNAEVERLIDTLPIDMQNSMRRTFGMDSFSSATEVTNPAVRKMIEEAQARKAGGGPIGQVSDQADLAQRQLAGEDIRPSEGDDILESVAAGYNNPDEYIDDLARRALDMEAGMKGGEMVRTADGFKRISEHQPWYSEYFAANKRAPSLQATRDMVREGLESGRGVSGLVYPDESRIYQLLQDREAGLSRTIAEGPPMEAYPQWMDQLGRAQRGGGRRPPVLQNPMIEPPGRQKAYLQSLQDDKRSTRPFKEALAEEPQKYTERPQQPMADRATELVNNDPNGTLRELMTKETLDDQDAITGYQLTGRLMAENRIDEGVDLAMKMDDAFRAGGRLVKAADVVGNLTPEGILRYATRKIRKGSEKISAGRGFEKGETGAKKYAAKVKKAVETAGQIDQPTAKKVVDELTTGEKIAEGVERMALPANKKKADQLVKEILKKVRETSLPAKGKKTTDPMQVLRDVFGRNAEAQEAFPEAQRILMERAKDNPALEEALQQFFESELGIPASGKTINNAIRQQLKQNETRVADIITQSWNGQKQSVDDIAAALTKEGFDADSAQLLGKEVVDRLNAQVSDAKLRALANLSRDIPDRAKTTFMDKVNKISNLGGLNDADYLEMARARLNLPNLTSEMAGKLSELSQKMQGLPDGFDKDEAAREIYSLIDDAIPKTKGEIAADVLSAPKSLMASFDLSGMVRQGGVLGSRFRKDWKNSFGKSIDYFKSDENFRRAMSEIKQDADYDMAVRAKLALTGIEGAEEAYISKLPEKIPLLGKGVKASDRAYTGGLTKLRFDSFKSILNDLRAAGFDMSELTDERLASIGKFINTASGIGTGKPGGLFEKMAPALNRTLFSPRLWKSRLDMLNPVYYYKLDPIARKYALQSAGTFSSIAATVFGLASLMGAEVETDARSSDFLKVRFGDTRYDILGGFQQNLVFAHRLLTGERKSSITGEVSDLTSGDYGAPNRLSLLTDLIENKSNPVIASAGRLLEGTDRAGEPVSLPSELIQLVTPLNIQDSYDVAREYDPFQALYRSLLPGTLGVGVNTYGTDAGGSGPFADWQASLGPTIR